MAASKLIPLGIRLPGALHAHIATQVAPDGGTVSAKVREIVEQHYETRPSGRVEPDCLPELMGAVQAAQALGTTASNLGKIAGLPEPLYAGDHPNPRRRLIRGSLYDAAAIRALAEQRQSGRGTLLDRTTEREG